MANISELKSKRSEFTEFNFTIITTWKKFLWKIKSWFWWKNTTRYFWRMASISLTANVVFFLLLQIVLITRGQSVNSQLGCSNSGLHKLRSMKDIKRIKAAFVVNSVSDTNLSKISHDTFYTSVLACTSLSQLTRVL